MKQSEAIQDLVDRILPGWGSHIRCNEGWYPLLAELHSQLVKVDPNFTIMQIKEKFGGLRFYAVPSDTLSDTEKEKFQDLINQAEGASYGISEISGKEGAIQVASKGGYVSTVHPSEIHEDHIVLGEN